MDGPHEPQDLLDKNITKLVRGAKPVEPARAGAQERVFGNVMNRLGASQRRQAKSQFWTIAVASAACLALGALLFTQFFARKDDTYGAVPVRAPRKLAVQTVPVTPTPNPAPTPELASTAQSMQIETLEEQTAQRKLSDGSVLDVAANSRVEVLTPVDPTQRPEVRIRSGEVSFNIPRGNGRVLIHSSAGDVLVNNAQLKVAVAKTTAPVLEQNFNGPPTMAALASSAPKVAMNVAVIRGEAILRETIGNEKLLVTGDTSTVGGQNETASAGVEHCRSGSLVPKLEDGTQGQPLEVRRHIVKASITEQIALVEVDETFYNPGNQRIEGTFVFPLPHDATICRLAMYVGDNLMEGEIAEAQRARRTFEALKVQQVDPALLEWAGGNMFKMRIFPIEPKSEKRVLISYYEVLKKDHGRINFSYPLASEATQKSPVGEVNVSVTVDSTPEIQNPTVPGYDTAVLKAAANHLDVSYVAKAVTPDKDFSLTYQTGKNAPLVTVPYWHAKRNEGYFVMIFSPELEQTSSEKHRPSNFVFVVDKSGGLGARQLALAVRTVKGALTYLTPNDHFSIVAYDTAAKKFQKELVTASPKSISEASTWLDSLESFGASDLTQAWKAASDLTTGGTTQIVYCGSGLSSLTSTQSGKLLADADAAFTGKDVRVHCLPLGTMQDLTFLNELAKKYSGTVRPIKDADDATTATSELLEDFAWPLYKNVQLAFDGISVGEVYPLALPNVTAGRQLLVFGKYKNAANGTVKLTASRDGEPFTQELKVNLGLDATHNFVPKLWATQRIAQLQLDVSSAAPEDAKQIVNDVVETSKRYRVMSQYTSFLVLETAEDYLRYGIERRPDEFDPNATQDIIEELSEFAGAAAPPKPAAANGEFGGLRQQQLQGGKAGNAKNDMKDEPQSDESERRQSSGSDRFAAQDALKRLSSNDGVEAGKFKQANLHSALRETTEKEAKALEWSDSDKSANRLEGGDDAKAERRKSAAAPAQARRGLALQDIETLSWERQDLFPVIDHATLPAWNQRNAHSTEKAMKILKGLSSRFDTLSLSVTAYTLDAKKQEVKQGRERAIVLDRTTGAFNSRFMGADFADICDGKIYYRLFPQLKYAVRSAATENDLSALGNQLPGYLMPWAEALDQQFTVSVDQDTEEGVILRLVDRSNINRYTLVYLTSKTGPLTKIETFERRRVNNDFKVVNTQTVLCEDVQTIGDYKMPLTFRTVQHNDTDVVSVVRLTNVKINEKLTAESFKPELSADWAIRDQDTRPAPGEQRSISPAVNPSPNFGPRRN